MTRAGGHKTGIRRKVAIIICISIIICGAIGVFAGYLLGSSLLLKVIGQNNQQTASLLADYVSLLLKGEVEDAQSYTTRPLWIDAVENANMKYAGMNDSDRERYFADMDKKWVASTKDTPFLKECLESRISLGMKDILQLRATIAELFITDKYGGLVAASGKTSDFSQADEKWWRKAYNEGEGNVFVGDVEFDESSKDWVIPIAVFMKGRDGSIIGICKSAISMKRLFGILETVKIGKTGHPVVVDADGRILFHNGINSMSRQFYQKEGFKTMFGKKNKYFILLSPHIHKGQIFTAFAKVESPYLSKGGIFWRLFIDQDIEEVFQPLHELVLRLLIVVMILLVIIVPIGYILGGIFTKPVHELHMATERIIDGDWDYKINIKTGDEIEQFADTFMEMISAIKDREKKLMSAKEELEELYKNLEKKVGERTKELAEANDASLNILEDLTESKAKLDEYSKELEKALAIKSSFTSTVSHELRTPLAAIKEGISIVLEGGAAGCLDDTQKKFLDMAQRNVDRLTRLINDILDFQKLEAGKMVFNLRDSDINDVVKEAGSSLSALLKNKGLKLDFDLAQDLPKIAFDKDKIIQVLMNLINNSIKVTEKGGISIATSRRDNTIEVSVTDTGPGIKKEDIPKLFQQFAQLEDGIRRRTGGTGLGLAICKEILEAHRGKIRAESEYGKGTTIYFSLPIKERRG